MRTFHRKQYIKLAEILRYLVIDEDTRYDIVKSVSKELKKDNPKFDRDRFRKAIYRGD